MVLKLSEALAVPPHGVNALLDAAGFAPCYAHSTLEADQLAPVHRAFQGLMTAHAPNPAYLLDRDWRLIRLNCAAARLLAHLGLTDGDSLLTLIADPARGAAVFENWAEVGHFALLRLRAESRAAGGIEALDRAASKLSLDPAVTNFSPARPASPTLETRIRMGPNVLSLWSMMVQAGGATDLALTDLRLEMLYPADAQAEAMLKAMDQ